MLLSGTEKDVLITIARLGKATESEITKYVRFTTGYIELICSYLIRKGYLAKFKRYYMLTEESERLLFSHERKPSLIDKGLIKGITNHLAEQVAQKVIAEMKLKKIKTERTRVSQAEKRVYPEKRQQIQIKTDFDLPIEDESLFLESNINKVGIKSEKEKVNINKSVALLKNIQKRDRR